MNCFLLLDVGGTFLKSEVCDAMGHSLPGSEFTCPVSSGGSKDEIVDSLVAVIDRGVDFLSRYRDNMTVLAGVALDFPGPFDYQKGISRMAHKFQSIYGLPLTDIIRSALKSHETTAGSTLSILPQIPVRYVHDVNVVLLGEMLSGAAVGYSDVAVVTLGTGLGFAMSQDGKPLCNPMGSPLVSIYNQPFRDGVLEDYASKRGFYNVYKEVTGFQYPKGKTVENMAAMASEGDPDALEVFSRVGSGLASALAHILEEHNIQCLLFGGQISKSFCYMRKSIESSLLPSPTLKKIAQVSDIDHAAFNGLFAVISADIQSSRSLSRGSQRL